MALVVGSSSGDTEASFENHISRLQELCQRVKWPLPRYADDPPPLQAETPFQVAVVVDVPGLQMPLSATGAPASNKRQARQLAAAALLASPDLEWALSQPGIGFTALSPSASVVPQVNYISKLNELMQLWRAEKPVYAELAREGPPHAPRFTVQVSVFLPGMPEDGLVQVAGGSAASLPAARQLAAERMLKLLMVKQPYLNN